MDESLRMNASAQSLPWLLRLLRADASQLYRSVLEREGRLAWACVLVIFAGAGAYGAVMGSWRSGLQSVYTGLKLPLVFLLTSLGNGLLNGMLAPLLGLNISFRQSLLCVLVSFTFAALILGSLSPVAAFLVWNTPGLSLSTALSSPEYGMLQLTLAVFIALAGVAANVRLFPLLCQWSPSRAIARNVLLAWLAGNLFLGSQICWVMRPFIWDPSGSTEFIGRQYWHGSFYETVFDAIRRLLVW
jgi:hypothetical protein